MDGADEGLLALDRPLRTAAPVWWPRPAVYALLAYFGVLLTIGGVLDDIRREFPVIAMTGGFVGLAGSLDLKPFEMDGRGLRGRDWSQTPCSKAVVASSNER